MPSSNFLDRNKYYTVKNLLQRKVGRYIVDSDDLSYIEQLLLLIRQLDVNGQISSGSSGL